MKKWKTLTSKEVFSAGFFKLRLESCALPDGRVMPRYYIADFPSWVHVIPVTKDNQVVMVKQFRNGVKDTFLEVPGGSFDGHGNETPQEAGARELREETGYLSNEWKLIGEHFPNPAFQSNRMYTYLALGCEKAGEPQLDPFEDIEVGLMSIPDVLKALENCEFKHSLVMSSMALARPYLLDLIS
jgi:8-oxo-dGTP pyrophosphatase MutT (NUDIX family)